MPFTTGPNSPINVGGLTNGQAYRSRIRARGPGGVSAWSAWTNSFTPQNVVTAAWTPIEPDATNKVLWIDPSDTSTVSVVSGAVSQVSDKSGSGRHLSQATAANRPTTTTVNGLNALALNGSQWLTGGAPNVSVADITVYAVLSQADQTTANQGVVSFGGAAVNDWDSPKSFSLNMGDASNLLSLNSNSGANGIGRARVLGSTAAPLGVYGAVKNASLLFTVYKDSQVGAYSLTPAGSTTWGTADGGITFGTRWIAGAVGTEHFNGTICEVLVFAETHGHRMRQKVEGYLAHKWGLAARLPAAHPYKTAAPVVGAAPKSVARGWQGAVTASSFQASVEFHSSGLTSRLRVSTTADLASPLYGAQVAATGTWAKLNSPALSANTLYHWGVEVSNGSGGWNLDPHFRGRIRTLAAGAGTRIPTALLAVGSCARAAGSAPDVSAFDRMAARNPTMILNTGDMTYSDITVNDPAKYREAFRNVLEHRTQGPLLRKTPVAYAWDDHDYGADNSSSTSAGKPAALATYREVVPHYPLAFTAAGDPIAHAFWVGRSLVVNLDTRSTRVAGTAKLGATQLAWVKSVIDGTATVQGLATSNARFLILQVGTPWIAGANTGDTWGEAAAERTEISDALVSAGRINSTLIVHGDSHSSAMDNGTNTGYQTGGGTGPRLFKASPFDRSNSAKGGPYSSGTPWQESQHQYGTIKVDDDGTNITVTCTAYRADTDAVLGGGAAVMEWAFDALTGSPVATGVVQSKTSRTPVGVSPLPTSFATPATLDAQPAAGALLLASFHGDKSVGTLTVGAGWTLLADATYVNTSVSGALAYRIAAGPGGTQTERDRDRTCVWAWTTAREATCSIIEDASINPTFVSASKVPNPASDLDVTSIASPAGTLVDAGVAYHAWSVDTGNGSGVTWSNGFQQVIDLANPTNGGTGFINGGAVARKSVPAGGDIGTTASRGGTGDQMALIRLTFGTTVASTPKAGTLSDDFTTLDTATKWNAAAGASIVSSQLRIACTSAYDWVSSQKQYDLVGSSAFVEVPGHPAPGAGSTNTIFHLTDGTNRLRWLWGNNTLYAERLAGTTRTTVAQAPYSAANHRWWRISESAGQIIWSVSPSGMDGSWTNFATWTHGNAFNFASMQVALESGYWGTETNPGHSTFDNFNVPGTAESSVRPFFRTADWLWEPIPSNPVLHANNTAIIGDFAITSGTGHGKIPHLHHFSVKEYGPDNYPANTRQEVPIAQDIHGDGPWGPAFSDLVPVPNSIMIPPPSIADYGDAHMAFVDTTNGYVYGYWRFRTKATGGYEASSRDRYLISGDGTGSGGTTAAKLIMAGGPVKGSEIAAGEIRHALFFSSNMAGPNPVFPAHSSAPGTNRAGVANPMPIGSRIQLDPTFDVSTITNVGQRIIARALQVYGAYCIDNTTGPRAGFAFEWLGGTESTLPSQYANAGFTISGGYAPHMSQIPWNRCRVLRSWNGA